MSVSDWSTLAVAVLTFFGLLVAAFTFYRSLGSKANLEMSVGDELILHYDGDSRLILTATFAFINRGAIPGTVTLLTAQIFDQATKPERLLKSLAWRTFEETTTSRNPSNGRTIWFTRSTSPVYTLIVPGRIAGSSGIVSKIRLYEEKERGSDATFEPLPPRKASYRVKFFVHAGSGPTMPREYECQLTIAERHAKNMKADCSEEDGTWQERLVSRRQPVLGSAARKRGDAGGVFESVRFRSDY